ncbi:MAG: rubrerythrin [Spirochaetes bacterium]|nr:rubrerythrin [Spirochaetota bacterium]
MEQIRCKACGLIIDEDKLGDICPACGVPRTAFEPYRENISRKRKTILNLNLHPITLHFPQAFSAVIPPFILLGVAIDPMKGRELMVTARALSILMPFTVAAAFLFGLLDGKTRFKRLSTPSLKMKIIIASLLMVLSTAMSAVAILYGTGYPGRLFLLFLSIGCITCQIFLAQIGKTLINAKLPG